MCFNLIIILEMYIMKSSNGNISALLALCQGNPPVTGRFRSQRVSKPGFDVSFGISLNRLLHKQLSAGELTRHGGYHDVTVIKNK